ncbi:hypothetical protein, variant [Gaeumannomyces tritici R3-111a-1]|uniref:NADAR domain-containing protein n=1 Tax=Gaeumannomyces tritici (strain R3-111a-1) TaxID=644352 RepID=J3P2P4_GAET3|nr:hypothetical protein GGTG_07790 [Gaeumannomyces tritici R3-111a-1]XP_009223881.1 hypothetical protein, variant [Gaeumannomyces tritici R3-111a-1]EJT73936.1 hypothetical protein, variant [Gaeumannomyces tritici R3-111a-1]EJT73937.1 hypothetical protein GGTG_07790 [Gaeumannomyces tritici R3-111a-1]
MIPYREAKATKVKKSKHKGKGGSSASGSQLRERSQSPTRPLYFFTPNERYGEFSQWYRSKFTVTADEIKAVIGRDLEDVHDDQVADPESGDPESGDPESGAAAAAAGPDYLTFRCAEQFMMYCKAARFGDRETQRLVMATDSPKEQKRLGRAVDGFDDGGWDEVKSAVVVAGNMAKFGQNAPLGRALLATGDRLLVEAASRDRVWGIGYTAKTAPHRRKHWGENRLGVALMEVRARLREREQGRKGEEWQEQEGEGE